MHRTRIQLTSLAVDGQSQQDLDQATSRGVEEDTKTMIECGKHISSCGVVDDMKIVLRPKTTVYVTQNVTTTVSTVWCPCQ